MHDWIAIEKKIPLTRHKYFNLQIGNEEFDMLFGMNINWTFRQDHAGFNLWLNLPFFYVIFYTYDHRHWCRKCQKYMTDQCYDEKHGEE